MPSTVSRNLQLSDFKALRQEFAEKASGLLGYGLLKKSLTEGRRAPQVKSRIRRPERFSTSSIKLDQVTIPILDTVEVNTYQQQQRRAHDRQSFFSLPLWAEIYLALDAIHGWIMRKIGSLAWFVLVIFSLAGGAGMVSRAIFSPGRWMTAGIGMLFFLYGCSVIYLIYVNWQAKNPRRPTWSWKVFSFRECTEREVEIPYGMLDTAVDTVEKLPHGYCPLFVSILINEQTQETSSIFLCLRDPSDGDAEMHYLELWG